MQLIREYLARKYLGRRKQVPEADRRRGRERERLHNYSRFRKYASAADSVADHSAYLLGAMNGSKQRYAGLKGETDPAKAIGIIKAGGYATDTKYVSKVLSIINKYELTEYDQATKGGVSNLKINQNPNFGTHNTSPRSGEIEYIVIHYVGATGTAKIILIITISAARPMPALIFMSASRAKSGSITRTRKPVTAGP